MKKFLKVRSDGFIESFGEVYSEDFILPADCVEINRELSPTEVAENAYDSALNRLVYIGPRPSDAHIYSNFAWVIDRNLLITRINAISNQSRGMSFSEKITFDGYEYDADQQAIANIQSTLLVYQLTKQLPEGFVWRTHDNQSVSMTYEKLQSLASAIYARNAQIYAQSWNFKDSLSAKTDQELLAIFDSLVQAQPI